MKTLSVILTLLISVSCSSTKYKPYTESQATMASQRIVGKSPKEAVAILGKPMSAYYDEDGSRYFLVYPTGTEEVGLSDLMFNDRLECMSFNFEKDKKFIYADWKVFGFTCGSIKGNKLDTSLID